MTTETKPLMPVGPPRAALALLRCTAGSPRARSDELLRLPLGPRSFASSYEAWGLDLSDDDQQAIMAGVVAARGEDTDRHAARFFAAQERAQKALDEEPLPAESDAAFVNAYDTIDEVSGTVMTRAEVQAMAESAALARSGPD